MKHTRAALLAGLTITAASVGAFVPAHAQETPEDNSTVATFTIAASGGLSISAPAAADLGEAEPGDASVTGSLGEVSVTDSRGLLLGEWTATASSSPFAYTDPDGTAVAAHDIDNGSVTYNPVLLSSLGGGIGVGAGGSLDAPRTAMRRATLLGNVFGNSEATWNPSITVALPEQSVIGTYTATITHSVN